MAKHITGLPSLGPPCRTDGDGERVVGVVGRRGHGQPNDQRGLIVKDSRREHQERMDVAHFTADLRVAVDPDDILAIRRPKTAL